jgi:hypothetical protein
LSDDKNHEDSAMIVLDAKWNALTIPMSVFSGPPPAGYQGWSKSAVSYYIHGLLVRELFDFSREIYSNFDEETNSMIYYQETFGWEQLSLAAAKH